MSKELSLSRTHVENLIFILRDTQVMIDRDLANIYQVETRVLNQAVKRNIVRFPEKFRFQLTLEEIEELKSQIATSNSKSQIVTLNSSGTQQGGNIKYLPYAFTEQGVAMLSAVLRSDIAIKVSIQIMDAFVEMRKLIAHNSGLLQRMDRIEYRQLETDHKFEQVFKALESKNAIPAQGVFFDGQVYDAYAFVNELIRSAEKSLILLDNYIDDTVLTMFTKRNENVECYFFTKNISKQLQLDIEKHNQQYEPIKIKKFADSHDRFLIIDREEIYHLGASLKDLGKKWFAFSKMQANSVENIMNSISELI